MKKLTEIFGLTEGYDDVERQLNGAQSLRGGPRTEPSVRKHQDRAHRWSPSTARAQSELDSAQSVAKKEAFGPGAQDIKNQLSTAKDSYGAISMAIKLAGTGKDPVEVASALHDALYGEGSQPKPLMRGGQGGQSVFKASGGMKLQ